jgi:hypothetical protein
VPTVFKSGSLSLLEPSGPVRPAMGLLYLHLYHLPVSPHRFANFRCHEFVFYAVVPTYIFSSSVLSNLEKCRCLNIMPISGAVTLLTTYCACCRRFQASSLVHCSCRSRLQSGCTAHISEVFTVFSLSGGILYLVPAMCVSLSTPYYTLFTTIYLV